MKIESTVYAVRNQVKEWKRSGLTVGFVPTMGYLHEGHASLIQAARMNNDRVVVSIFVNPMQFGPKEDLASYPRDLEKDSVLCASLGVDLIFHPEPEEMYHAGFSSYVDMDILTQELCGLSRPAFQGRVHGSLQAVPHCRAGQGLFRSEGCAAACGYPPHGGGSQHGH